MGAPIIAVPTALVFLDMGGDSLLCDGAGDLSTVFNEGQMLTFSADTAVRTRLNLLTGAGEILP